VNIGETSMWKKWRAGNDTVMQRRQLSCVR
jgi:hypothetical protein